MGRSHLPKTRFLNQQQTNAKQRTRKEKPRSISKTRPGVGTQGPKLVGRCRSLLFSTPQNKATHLYVFCALYTRGLHVARAHEGFV